MLQYASGPGGGAGGRRGACASALLAGCALANPVLSPTTQTVPTVASYVAPMLPAPSTAQHLLKAQLGGCHHPLLKKKKKKKQWLQGNPKVWGRQEGSGVLWDARYGVSGCHAVRP